MDNFTEHQHQMRPLGDQDGSEQKHDHSVIMCELRQKQEHRVNSKNINSIGYSYSYSTRFRNQIGRRHS